MNWRQLFQVEPVMLRRDHDEMVAILTANLAAGDAREMALRDAYEALTFATVTANASGKTPDRLVRRGVDAVKQAILEKSGSDMALARYLGNWVKQERAKKDAPDEGVLIGHILNWDVADDTSDDAMPA